MVKKEIICCKERDVIEFLRENTDNYNSMTFKEIEKGLKKQLGLPLNRKTLLNYLNHMESEKQIAFTGDGPKRKYYFTQTDEQLSINDITVLIDCIQSVKCLPSEMLNSLRNKLLFQTSKYEREKFKDDTIFKYIDEKKPKVDVAIINTIIEAINLRHSVLFNYYKYTFTKQRIRRSDSVVVYPQAIIIDDGYYYLIAYKPERNSNYYYRIDRMGDVKIADIQGEIPNSCRFNRGKFLNSNFKMFKGENKVLHLKSKIDYANQIIDKFGDYKLLSENPDNDDMFSFEVEVEVGNTFYGWLCGFAGGIKIIGPEEEKLKFNEYVNTLL